MKDTSKIEAPNTMGAHQPDEEVRLLRGALENLVLEVRMAAGVRNTLGLKVNVALNVAERALRRFPSRDDG